MKKKMLAMMMAVLMAGAMLSFTAAAEEEYLLYLDFEDATEVANKYSALSCVADPTDPENHVIKTQAKASGTQKMGVRIYKRNEDNKNIPMPEGTYRLSIRAFAYEDASPYTAFINGSSYNDNTSVIWNSAYLDFSPKRIKANQWTTITYYFYLDATTGKSGNCALNLRNDVGTYNVTDVYWDDLKFEKLNSNFLYTNDTAYQSVDIWANGYNEKTKEIYSEMLYGARTGADVTALSGNAESIRPVFFGRSEDYGEAVTVIHAVYEVKNGKKALYDVKVSNVTKNVRNILVSDDTVLSIPAKTAEASYEVKSFILDMENGLAPLGNISSLAVAAQ